MREHARTIACACVLLRSDEWDRRSVLDELRQTWEAKLLAGGLISNGDESLMQPG